MSLEKNIKKLRTNAKLTQSEFAELFGVSHQSVQKWESGDSKPDLDNIVRISKHFGITVDCLMFDTPKRAEDENHRNRELVPSYVDALGWEVYSQYLMMEFKQCIDEGLDIAKYEGAFRGVSELKLDKYKRKLADVLFEIVLNADQVKGFRYDEPSELDAIKQARVGLSQKLPTASGDGMREKIAGAWYGRICGCTAGKNVEGILSDELIKILKSSGNYPMRRYILSTDITDDMRQNFRFKLAGKTFPDMRDHAPSDDDTNYTVLYQRVIEKYGRDFSPFDVSRAWLSALPKDYYCTAERVAYCNFVRGYMPPDSAIYQNPFREWIGAQIRGDYFGYINPGDPETAAEMAWRDASVSHIKNGIYGEMFVAAMIAAAAVCEDMEEIIRVGLSQIPAKSRLFEAICGIIDTYNKGVSADDCFASIHKRWDESNAYDWCHTVSNAEIVAAALLYGCGDYGTSVGLAVQAAFDTDCNGATVGSVIGMKNGIRAIGKEWTERINGKLFTDVGRLGIVNIESLIDKTMEHISKK